MSGWSDAQVRAFARRFAAQHRGHWDVLVPAIREAAIDSFVLLVVLGQDGDAVRVEDVRSLRARIAARLATSWRMPNPTAELVAEETA